MFAKLKRKRYPKLSIISEDSTKIKLVTPEKLKKLLKPKEENEFDSISYSGSEISDVFEEEHQDIFTTKIQSQKLSKLKNKSTKSSFTAQFTKTMMDLRKELHIGDNITTENMDGIKVILTEKREPPPISQSLKDRLEEILKDREFLYSSSSEISDQEIKNEDKSVKENTGKPYKIYSKELKCNNEVGLNSINCNTQEESQDKPTVSWQTFNFSRLKCEKWLNKQKYLKVK